MQYLVMFFIALLITSIGFRRHAWLFSVCYGLTIAVIGIAMPVFFRRYMSTLLTLECILLLVYGLRVAGYSLGRELLLPAYADAMQYEPAPNPAITWKLITWIGCSLIYTLQLSPVLFRLANGGTTDLAALLGTLIMLLGLILESAADFQKYKAKKKRPDRFVDTGLYRLVRCPNYFGALLFWTGVFVSGLTALRGPLQWVFAAIGYVCIILLTLWEVRRLELRQDLRYGEDSRYKRYVKNVPILIPFVPLYSLSKLSFLLG